LSADSCWVGPISYSNVSSGEAWHGGIEARGHASLGEHSHKLGFYGSLQCRLLSGREQRFIHHQTLDMKFDASLSAWH